MAVLDVGVCVAGRQEHHSLTAAARHCAHAAAAWPSLAKDGRPAFQQGCAPSPPTQLLPSVTERWVVLPTHCPPSAQHPPLAIFMRLLHSVSSCVPFSPAGAGVARLYPFVCSAIWAHVCSRAPHLNPCPSFVPYAHAGPEAGRRRPRLRGRDLAFATRTTHKRVRARVPSSRKSR